MQDDPRQLFFGQTVNFKAGAIDLKGSLHRARTGVTAQAKSQIMGLADLEDKPQKTPVLLLHSMGGNRHEAAGFYIRLAAELCLAGYDVLRFDFRGCGESAGEQSDFYPSNLIEDARAAMKFLLQESQSQGIHLVGYSLGGLIASMLLEADGEKLESLSLIQAPFNLSKELKRRFPVGRGDFRTTTFVNAPMFRLPERFHQEIEALEHSRRPAERPGIPTGCTPSLVITGSKDVIVPEANSLDWLEWLQPRCPKVEHCSIASADHGFSSQEDMQLCIKRLCEWLSVVN